MQLSGTRFRSSITRFEDAEVTMIPQTTTALSEEDTKKMERLIEMLEENDDVQDIHHNAEEIE